MSWLKILTSKYQDHSDTESIDSEVDGINNVRESESNMDPSGKKTKRPLPSKSSPAVPLLHPCTFHKFRKLVKHPTPEGGAVEPSERGDADCEFTRMECNCINLTDLSEKLTTIIDELEAVQETTPMTPENNISTQTPEPTQPYWLNTLKYYLCYCLAR